MPDPTREGGAGEDVGTQVPNSNARARGARALTHPGPERPDRRGEAGPPAGGRLGRLLTRQHPLPYCTHKRPEVRPSYRPSCNAAIFFSRGALIVHRSCGLSRLYRSWLDP